MAYTVAQLRRQDAALLADALGALHSLCQLSRSRQEQAAEQRAAVPLVQLVLAPQPSLPPQQHGPGPGGNRSLAVSLLCTFGELVCAGCRLIASCCYLFSITEISHPMPPQLPSKQPLDKPLLTPPAAAHGGARCRQELWAVGGFEVLLGLLKEEAYQSVVLDALAAWLEQEPPRVEA